MSFLPIIVGLLGSLKSLLGGINNGGKNPIELPRPGLTVVCGQGCPFFIIFSKLDFKSPAFWTANAVSEGPGGSNPVISYVITIDDGIFSFEDFKDEFERQQALGGFSGTPITFTVNRNTGKFKMVVAPTCQIEMSITSAVMFGFVDKTTVPEYANGGQWWTAVNNFVSYLESSTTTSTFTAEWSMGILSLNLETDITTNSIANGKSAHVIANFSPNTVPFGKITYEPINPVYLQVGTRAISGIKIRITDQSGNVVPLRDEVDMLFVIRPFGMGS